jgi:hypothetical protein
VLRKSSVRRGEIGPADNHGVELEWMNDE